MRIGIEFEEGTGGGGRVEDSGDVDRIGFAFEQDASGQVTEHGHVGIFHRADEALGHFGFAEGEGRMDTGHHVIELGEDGVGEIERAVLEDIALGAAEEPESVEVLVQRSDFGDLLFQTGGVEAVGLDGGFAVVGNAEVFQAQFLRGSGHLGQRTAPVAGAGVVVERAFELLEFDQVRQLIPGRRLELAAVLAQFRLDIIETKQIIDPSLVVDLGNFRCVRLDRRESVFVERPPAVLGQPAQHDVVLLAPGEIHEGERILLVGDNPEVGLQPVLEHDARFCISGGKDALHHRVLTESAGDGGGVLRRDNDVDVVDCLIAAARAPAGGQPDGVRMSPQIVKQGGRGTGGNRGEVASGPLTEYLEAVEDFLLCFGPEAVQAGDFVLLAGFFQTGERRDLELFVEGFDFFRSEAGDVEEFEQSRREPGDKFVIIRQLAGGDESPDLFPESFSNAGNGFQFVFPDERSEVVFEHFEGTGAIVVGADLERIFALELEQKGDALKDLDGLVAGDGRHKRIVAAGDPVAQGKNGRASPPPAVGENWRRHPAGLVLLRREPAATNQGSRPPVTARNWRRGCANRGASVFHRGREAIARRGGSGRSRRFSRTRRWENRRRTCRPALGAGPSLRLGTARSARSPRL